MRKKKIVKSWHMFYPLLVGLWLPMLRNKDRYSLGRFVRADNWKACVLFIESVDDKIAVRYIDGWGRQEFPRYRVDAIA